MSDMNVLIISGTLTDDPIVREFGNGGLVAKIDIESRNQYKTREGEIKESRQFNKATLWNSTATGAQQFLRKGARVMIQGSLSTESYEKNGQLVYVKQIKVDKIEPLDGAQRSSQQNQSNWGSTATQSASGWGSNNSNQDPIPF